MSPIWDPTDLEVFHIFKIVAMLAGKREGKGEEEEEGRSGRSDKIHSEMS